MANNNGSSPPISPSAASPVSGLTSRVTPMAVMDSTLVRIVHDNGNDDIEGRVHQRESKKDPQNGPEPTSAIDTNGKGTLLQVLLVNRLISCG
jgi:hypothetical protein